MQDASLEDYVKNIPQFPLFYNVYTLLSMC